MLLTIDIGNSRIKTAVFENNTLIDFSVFEKDSALNGFEKNFKKFSKIKNSISSSVSLLDENCKNFIQKNSTLVEVNHTLSFPFTNLYGTPTTLGIDRMVLMAGASLLFPNQNVLVIDNGTCVTYDFLHEKNQYFGGAISPGLRTRYKSLHTFTAKLPLLQNELPESFIGNSTNQSIHSGVVNGLTYEIEGFISQYSLKNKDLTIILTGGDADFLAKSLKSTIFVRSNFLLESLNALFNYLKEKNE